MVDLAAPATPAPHVSRWVVVANLALAGTYLLAVPGRYLLAMAQLGGHVVPGQDDPKDVLPFSTHWWNPFLYVHALSVLIALLGWLLIVPLTGWSAVLLVRRRTVGLVASVVCGVAYVAVWLGYGSFLHTWLLD